MRGRTNTHLYSGVALNGVLENYEVAAGENIVNGDFVKINPEYKDNLIIESNLECTNFYSAMVDDCCCLVCYGNSDGTDVILYNVIDKVEILKKRWDENIIKVLQLSDKSKFYFIYQYQVPLSYTSGKFKGKFGLTMEMVEVNKVESYNVVRGGIYNQNVDESDVSYTIECDGKSLSYKKFSKNFYLFNGGDVIFDLFYSEGDDSSNKNYHLLVIVYVNKLENKVTIKFAKNDSNEKVYTDSSFGRDIDEIFGSYNFKKSSFASFYYYYPLFSFDSVVKDAEIHCFLDFVEKSGNEYIFTRSKQITMYSYSGSINNPLFYNGEDEVFFYANGEYKKINFDGNLTTLSMTNHFLSGNEEVEKFINLGNYFLVIVKKSMRYDLKVEVVSNSETSCITLEYVDISESMLIQDAYIIKFGEFYGIFMLQKKSGVSVNYVNLYEFKVNGGNIGFIPLVSKISKSNNYLVNGVANQDGKPGDVIEVYVPYKSN